MSAARASLPRQITETMGTGLASEGAASLINACQAASDGLDKDVVAWRGEGVWEGGGRLLVCGVGVGGC